MSEEKKDKPKVAKEEVVHEHRDGSPHITFDREAKTLNHYPSGCPFARARAEEKRSGHAGPAQVASDRYRSNWDNINWGTSRGKDLPS